MTTETASLEKLLSKFKEVTDKFQPPGTMNDRMVQTIVFPIIDLFEYQQAIINVLEKKEL
jgi:hypothetical protein